MCAFFTSVRRGRDSNPRYGVTAYTLSKRAPSTARPPLRVEADCSRGYKVRLRRGSFSWIPTCAGMTIYLSRRLDLQRAELELGNLAVGIEGLVGQQVGGGFAVAERHEHLTRHETVVGTRVTFDRAAS